MPAAAREAAGVDLAGLPTKAGLQAGLAALEARMTWRIVGVAVAANGVLAAVLGGLLVAVLDRLP